MDQFDVEPLTLKLGNAGRGKIARVIGRVVEDLDLELVLRVIDFAHRAQQSFYDVDFVENRELHRHDRQLVEMAGGDRAATAVLQEQINDDIPVNPVCGEADQHTHVADRPNDR